MKPPIGRLVVLGKDGEKRESLSKRLRELGYEVDSTADEHAVRDLILAGGHDLLLVDSCMAASAKKKSSMEALVSLPGARVPFLVFGSSNELDHDGSWFSGADGFLTETDSLTVLGGYIHSFLDRARLRRQVDTLSDQLTGMRKLSDDFTRVILPIGIALSAEKDMNLVIERILLEAKSLCSADAGTLYLRTDEDSLKFEIMHTDSLKIRLGGSTGSEIPFPPLKLIDPVTGKPNHHNVATHVALEGETVNIPDIYNAEGFDFSGTKAFDAKNRYRSISSLTVPLKDHDAMVIGVLQLLNARDPATGTVTPFDAYLQRIVELLSSQAAIALSNQLLMRREKKLLKFENDVQIGRSIQLDFLPEKLPNPPGCEVVSCFRPAREVSGDFYDAFMLPGSSHMGIVIADVCDKGVPAALFMAVIRSLIRAFSEQHTSLNMPILSGRNAASPGSVEHRLTTLFEDLNALNTVAIANNYLARNHSQLNMFATLFLGVFDPHTGVVTYINGGHEAPVIMGKNGISARLGQTGPAVGMIPDAEYELMQHQMEDGDILFAYTDGIPDSRDRNGQFFTEKRLFSLLEKPFDSASALMAAIESSLLAHIADAEQFDDITMVALRWTRGVDAAGHPHE